MRIDHVVPLEGGGVRYSGKVWSRMAWRRGRWVRVWYQDTFAALGDDTARDAVREDEIHATDGAGPPVKRRLR